MISMEFFRIHRDIPFMRHALVLNIISAVTFLAAVFFSRGLVNLWYGRQKKLKTVSIGTVWRPAPEAGAVAPSQPVTQPATQSAKAR